MEEIQETTLEAIRQAAKAEFLEKGFQLASLRKIVKMAGMTTGAFYGYYESKEALFASLVQDAYDFMIGAFKKAQQDFADIPHIQQPDNMGDISKQCMLDMLHYAYAHLDACKLLLCGAEGTRFAGFIDEMVEIEVKATHEYQAVLEELGHPSPKIDLQLEHMLITGMFYTFFEPVIHEMPLVDAEKYITDMQAFYSAGWMKIMGQ